MNRFLQLDINKKGRDFVIGDIHGKYNLLMLGLERVNFDFNKDRLIAVGDLIDRGKENIQVLNLIREDWFYTVIGNHELMMVDAIGSNWRTTDHMHWIMSGGAWYNNLTVEEQNKLKNVYVPTIQEELPYGIEFIAENGKKVGVLHAEIPRQWPWWEIRKHFQDWNERDHITNTVVWARQKIYRTGEVAEVLGIDILVHGHTPTKKRIWRGNCVYIDHGAYNPYQLTPINVIDLLEENEYNPRGDVGLTMGTANCKPAFNDNF